MWMGQVQQGRQLQDALIIAPTDGHTDVNGGSEHLHLFVLEDILNLLRIAK